MSELSFEQMLEDSVKTIRNGEIVQGKVIDVKEDEIIMNIGYKADGISPRVNIPMMLHLYSQMQFMLVTAWKQKFSK